MRLIVLMLMLAACGEAPTALLLPPYDEICPTQDPICESVLSTGYHAGVTDCDMGNSYQPDRVGPRGVATEYEAGYAAGWSDAGC